MCAGRKSGGDPSFISLSKKSDALQGEFIFRQLVHVG
jgi:hypothetical protein